MRRTQGGFISIVFAILVVAGLLFLLQQTNSVVQVRNSDTALDVDSAQALLLAESGLQRATAEIITKQTSQVFDAATCTSFTTLGTSSVATGRGTGTFRFTAATPNPANCAAGSCTSCTVTAQGQMNNAVRSVSMNFNLATVFGVAGVGRTVTMVLSNTYDVPAVALFDLSWRRQGQGGNASTTLQPCPTCILRWNLESSSGKPSVGGVGTTVAIAAQDLSEVITNVLSYSRDFVEVGGLYPSISADITPTVIASYWSDGNQLPTTKAGNNSTSAGVSSGVARVNNLSTTAYTAPAVDGTTCLAGTTGPNPVPNPPPNGGNPTTIQTCNSWCWEADTLVYGFAGRSSNVAAQLQWTQPWNQPYNGVKFGTTVSGTSGSTSYIPLGGGTAITYPTQNKNMTMLVHFPNVDGSIGVASGAIYSEEWYTYNKWWYASGGAGVSSYPNNVYGTVGAVYVNGNVTAVSNGDTQMTGSVTSGEICPGDVLTVGTSITIKGTPAGTTACSSATGVYTFVAAAAGLGGSNQIKKGDTVTVNSKYIRVKTTDVTGSALTTTPSGITATYTTATNTTATAALTAGPGAPGANTATAGYTYYTLQNATYLGAKTFFQGTPTAGKYFLPTGASTPPGNTIIQIHSFGQGGAATAFMPAQTTVTGTGTGFFTAATTNLVVNANFCGGICALFTDPSSTSSTTNFTLTFNDAFTTQWASGFACIKDVDPTKIIPVSARLVKDRNWWEGP